MRKKEIKVDFHIRKNQRNLGKHFFQGVISSTLCITHYTLCITQRPMRTSQAYLPLSVVRRIIAGKKLRNTIAQQLDSCCARASYKSDKQAYLVIQSWFDFH